MSRGAVSNALAPVRVHEWWSSKIPLLLAIAYAWAARGNPADAPWGQVAAVLAAVCCVAAFGYIVNDAFDIDEDARSGRPNRMARFTPAVRGTLLAVPLALGAVVAALARFDGLSCALLAVNFALPGFYSIPPVRVKERGFLGALADAGAAHLVPMLLLGRVMTTAAPTADAAGNTVAMPSSTEAVVFVLAAASWSFLVGLRGILAHQVADVESDRAAGVRTFASTRGVEWTRRLALNRLRPLELVALAAFLAIALPAAPWAAVALAVALGLEALKWRRGWVSTEFGGAAEAAGTSAADARRYVPLLDNELHEIWLPLGFLAEIVVRSWMFAPLAALHVWLFWPNIRTRLRSTLPVLLPSSVPPEEVARAALEQLRRPLRPALPEVVLDATYWTVNGVNIFSANLARGLRAQGDAVRILLTEENTRLIQFNEALMPKPQELTFDALPVSWRDGWGTHWAATLSYLEERAPCIFVPNSDWRHSSVVPLLSDRVIVVGVVHSDDPLHYDHVKRLGRYWNAIVCVSQAVAENVIARCPEIAARVVTIPIGAVVPPTCPAHVRSPERLRVVYHGVLKQHQKRVLDFPRIVAAADALGVPVELTLAGSGPDEAALREACAPFVARGLIRFAGLVAPWETPSLLEAHDVYLLVSEFEGMPNALIEAMGRGCVPVVSRMESGIPQLVRDGENGFMAPIGDAEAFAALLQRLWVDRPLLDRLSSAAHRTVVESEFRVERMVASYRRVFVQAAADAAAGRFVRPTGELNHPPESVAGVSLFPVALHHHAPGLGLFPSLDDEEGFVEEKRRSRRAEHIHRVRPPNAGESRERPSRSGIRVIFAAGVWTDNGVNRQSEDLVRGLVQAGVEARLLLTEERTRLVTIDAPRLPRPTDIPVDDLMPSHGETWGARWGAMQRYLEDRAPCIYLPNDDWRHACVVPQLSHRVAVVGAIHEPSALYLDHATRCGRFWNAAVVSTRGHARQVRSICPELDERLAVMPIGLAVTAAVRGPGVPKSQPAEGLHVLVVALDPAWALDDVASTVAAIRRGVSTAHVTVLVTAEAAVRLGGGQGARAPGADEFVVWCARPARTGLTRLYQRSHVVVAPSLRGDSHVTVVEAMAHGCVPVVVSSDAADADVVVTLGAGLVADGGPASVAVRVDQLRHDAEGLAVFSEAAGRAARQHSVSIEDMIEAYLSLFDRVLEEAGCGLFRRAVGPVSRLPASVDGIGVFPVEHRYRSALGAFPTARDHADYQREAGGGWRWVPRRPVGAMAPKGAA